jgi:hypothetical protein
VSCVEVVASSPKEEIPSWNSAIACSLSRLQRLVGSVTNTLKSESLFILSDCCIRAIAIDQTPSMYCQVITQTNSFIVDLKTHLLLNVEVRSFSQTLNNQLVALSASVDVLDVICVCVSIIHSGYVL